MKLELFVAALLFYSTTFVHAQGSLTPTGAPAPTMKTLEQIEPRKMISSLPVNITTPGSYYVTGNLNCTSGAGIVIFADNVTIDLNGCTLTGSPGASDGIATFPTRTNIVVRNGVLRNWPGMGVRTDYAPFAQIENVTVLKSGSYGFFVDENTSLVNCTSSGNGGAGIYCFGYASIRSCNVRSNAQAGIVANGHSIVTDCTVSQNGMTGISAGQNSQVNKCISTYNGGAGGGAGIQVQERSQVVDCTTANNWGHGISAGTKALVRNCSSSTNTQSGIAVGTSSLLSECVAADNTFGGLEAGAGSRVERSVSSGNGSTGISVAERCTVSENTVSRNSSDGIRATTECVITRNQSASNGNPGSNIDGIYITGYYCQVEENRVMRNARYGIAIQNAGGMNVIMKNVAIQNTTGNYSIATGNDAGPINNASSSSNPFANITF